MPKIIVEICQNFKGDKKILKEMIYQAKASGADIAKVQSYLSSELTPRPEFETENPSGIVRPYQVEFDRLKSADLSDEDMAWFVAECRKVGIEPMTTIFTRQRIPYLSTLDWSQVKVASYDCASYPMILELKEKFKHLYISTGATYDAEIEKTAKLLAGKSFSFIHCVTIYPTPLAELNLARMQWLSQFTPSVGFSDHSLVSRDGILASLSALALGADVIERHFTILDPSESKDGPVSINPAQLKELADWAKKPKVEILEYVKKNVDNWQQVIGQPTREMSQAEINNRAYYRGRFASKVGDEWIYNWQDKKVF
ncbi:MAG: N-acetylneuraminate synthase family protein [Candidatus Buchananbacteria bacterium]